MSELAALRAVAEALREADDVQAVVDATLEGAARGLGYEHVFLTMLEAGTERLHTLGSRGYERSGVGSEVVVGQGPVGVVARTGQAMRLGTARVAMRTAAAGRDRAAPGSPEIPLPGLSSPGSQLVVPLVAGGELHGVLAVESARLSAFGLADEHALVVLGTLAAAALERTRLHELQEAPEVEPSEGEPADATAPAGAPRRVQHYRVDDSVFVDDEYVIRGLAGRILVRMLEAYLADGRTRFTNKQLRVDPALRLSPLRDNLESRLLLLRQRLHERECGIALRKTGRGRLSLVVEGPVALQVVQDPDAPRTDP